MCIFIRNSDQKSRFECRSSFQERLSETKRDRYQKVSVATDSHHGAGCFVDSTL